jgi:hypothetical protein
MGPPAEASREWTGTTRKRKRRPLVRRPRFDREGVADSATRVNQTTFGCNNETET